MNSSLSYNFKQDVTDVTPNGFVVFLYPFQQATINWEYQNIDNETLKRMKQLEKLSPEDKSHVFAMLDAFFAKNKLQSLLI